MEFEMKNDDKLLSDEHKHTSCVNNVKRSFWCRIGLHDWYKGSFSSPVWGRYERHCLDCDKKQYSVYKDKKEYWINF